MRLPFHVIGSTIALAVLMTASSAQQLKPIEPSDPWLTRSETVTESLLKDTPSLTSFDRSLLFARLSDTWWQDDEKRARSWMRQAIEILEYVPDGENAADRSQRLATARSILKFIAGRDENLGRRVKAVFVSTSERDSGTERNLNADALIEEALAIIDRDPQRAAVLGAESLRVGQATLLSSLLWRLRSRDPKLADGLFAQAVAMIPETNDDALLNSLLRVAFPILVQQASLSVPPDPLRAQLLLAVAAYFRNAMAAADSQVGPCSEKAASLIFVTAPLLPEFDRLLPAEQSTSVRQFILRCTEGLGTFGKQYVENEQRDASHMTVDDFIEAADKAKEARMKTLLLAHGAQLAVSQKDFDRGIAIIDGMDDDSRKFMGGTWEAWRWDWAVKSALDHLKHEDLAGLRRVIAAVPSGLRATAEIGLAYSLSAKSDRPLAIEFTQSGHAGLSKSDLSAADKVDWFVALVDLYAKHLPEESFLVLRETVAAMNRAGNRESNDYRGSELLETETVYKLPVSIFESNEFSFLETVAAVESPSKRARIKLELLKASLERYRSSIKPRKTASREGR